MGDIGSTAQPKSVPPFVLGTCGCGAEVRTLLLGDGAGHVCTCAAGAISVFGACESGGMKVLIVWGASDPFGLFG